MKISFEPFINHKEKREKAKRKWHIRFAWRPVRLENELSYIWLGRYVTRYDDHAILRGYQCLSGRYTNYPLEDVIVEADGNIIFKRDINHL